MCDFVCDGGICLPVFATDGVCACVLCACACACTRAVLDSRPTQQLLITLTEKSLCVASPINTHLLSLLLLFSCSDATTPMASHSSTSLSTLFLWSVLLRQLSAPVWTEIHPSAVHFCLLNLFLKN